MPLAEVEDGASSRRRPRMRAFAALLELAQVTLELSEVARVAGQTGAAVYDPRTDEHHHLVCRRCGAIADIDATLDPSELLLAACDTGFVADYAEVVVTGLCASCRT